MLAPDRRCLDELAALLQEQGRDCWRRIRRKFDDAQFCARAPLVVIDCFVDLETTPQLAPRAKIARLQAEVAWLQRLPELPNPPAPRSLLPNSSTTSRAT